jgi:hypothetical protein
MTGVAPAPDMQGTDVNASTRQLPMPPRPSPTPASPAPVAGPQTQAIDQPVAQKS